MQGVAEIQVKGGYVTLIDERDYDRLSRFPWRLSSPTQRYVMSSYKTMNGIRTYGLMHRIIAGALPYELVDHINGDTLDNRRCNLRLVTAQQNTMNRGKHKKTLSQYKGVSMNSSGRFRATIRANYMRINLGTFKDEDDAARAYNKAALEVFGEYARLNKVDDAKPE